MAARPAAAAPCSSFGGEEYPEPAKGPGRKGEGVAPRFQNCYEMAEELSALLALLIGISRPQPYFTSQQDNGQETDELNRKRADQRSGPLLAKAFLRTPAYRHIVSRNQKRLTVGMPRLLLPYDCTVFNQIPKYRRN